MTHKLTDHSTKEIFGAYERETKNFFINFWGIPIIGGKKNNMLWAVNILQVYK